MADEPITSPAPDAGTWTNTTEVGTDQTVSDTDGTQSYVLGDLVDNMTGGPPPHVDDGTDKITASGDSADTIVYSFTVNTTDGQTSNFLLDWDHPQLATSDDGDYTSNANFNAWYSEYAEWQASLGDGWDFGDATTIDTWMKAKQGSVETDVTLNIVATMGGETTVTNDTTGHDNLLAFAIGSDHIQLDGITKELFDTYFSVGESTHPGPGASTVDDLVINFGDGSNWSVDLIGIYDTAYANATAAGQSLQDYVWENIVQHA
jgi:hypothetical protein